MLAKDPLDRHLHSREALVTWLLDKHNQVNLKLGKRAWTIDEFVKDFRQRHDPKPSSLWRLGAQNAQTGQVTKSDKPCCTDKTNVLIWILLGFGAFLGIAYFLSLRKKQ